MIDEPILRDERTIQIENASYRLGYQFLAYGVLVIVTVRGFLFQQSSWDLLALAIASGIVTTGYQYFHRTLTRRWLFAALLLMVISAVTALAVTLVVR